MSMRNWTVFFIAIFLVLAVVACNTNPQPQGLTPVPSLAPAPTLTLAPVIAGGISQASAPTGKGSAAAGAAVFERNCTSCHGVNGEGGVGLTLRNDVFIKGDEAAIIDTVSTGRPGTAMPAWAIAEGGPLPADQILNVVAYLHTLQSVPIIPKPTPAPEEAVDTPVPNVTLEPAHPSHEGGVSNAVNLTGNANRGKPLFGQFCATCHGPQGVLGYPNPGTEDGSVPVLNPIDPSIPDKDPKVFAQNLDLFIEHGSVPDGDNPALLMPAFGDATMLAPQDIADIMAYMIQLNTPQ